MEKHASRHIAVHFPHLMHAHLCPHGLRESRVHYEAVDIISDSTQPPLMLCASVQAADLCLYCFQGLYTTMSWLDPKLSWHQLWPRGGGDSLSLIQTESSGPAHATPIVSVLTSFGVYSQHACTTQGLHDMSPGTVPYFC